jgi:hypothetical protein
MKKVKGVSLRAEPSMLPFEVETYFLIHISFLIDIIGFRDIGYSPNFNIPGCYCCY